jgi:hypothetical protein
MFIKQNANDSQYLSSIYCLQNIKYDRAFKSQIYTWTYMYVYKYTMNFVYFLNHVNSYFL